MKKIYPYYPKTVKNRLSYLKVFLNKNNSWLENLYERSYTMKMGHLKFPYIDVYIPNEPELIHRVMILEVKSFPKHHLLHTALKPLLGQSIFTTNNKIWKKQRELLNPSFEMVQIKNVFDLMYQAVDDMMIRLKEREKEECFDIDEEMTFITADIIFRTILSKKLTQEEGKKIVDAFVVFQETSFKINIQKIFFIPKLLRSWKREKAYHNSGNLIRTTLAKIIKPRYEALEKDDIKKERDILSFLLKTKDKQRNEHFSFEEILDQVSMLFLAGHETTASSLTWTIYLLALYPNYQEEAYQEVLEVSKEELFDIQKIKSLSFLTNCFKESLRLYPPVSAFPREATKETMLRDKKIKKGSVVFILPWLMHRNERFWKDAHMFNPRRFDKPDEIIKDTFFPFGLGERICIGANFAMQESILILASLLQSYKIELKEGFEPHLVGRLTTRSQNGMQIKLIHREN